MDQQHAQMPDTNSSSGNSSATAWPAGLEDSPTQLPRLHRQPAAAAAAFNYTKHQQDAPTNASNASKPLYRQQGLLLPPSFQQLPRLSSLCIGYLRGTSSNLVEALMRQQPGCVKGPLKPPGNNYMVQDVLSVILQVSE
jgi:hypothetical protein